MSTWNIHSNIRDYTANIENTPDFMAELAAIDRSYFVVDENVWLHHGATLLNCLPKENLMILPISEDRKNLDGVQQLYDKLIQLPAKRNLTVVSVGGGILQDITGFAASTIYRGINWVFVPTTLLAQADSCIGGKTSLNYGGSKNLLGTFYPPSHIHIYAPFLLSLATNDFFSGLGEVIKLHLMGGPDSLQSLIELLPQLTKRNPSDLIVAIRQALDVKFAYMEGDEFDLGRRKLLNFGHDFGHALESTSLFAIPHGQAVIVGILAANIVAAKRSCLSADLEQELAKKVLLPNLVVRPSREMLDKTEILNAMKKDKKRTGENLVLIMMEDGFNLRLIDNLKPAEVEAALDCLQSEYLA
jgi:3-dehydroquinate synthase